MPNTWLFLDGNFLCHRAYHSVGKLGLSHKGLQTGLLFALMRDVVHMQDTLNVDRLAFAFDHPPLKRKEIYPPYKEKRKPVTEEEAVTKQVISDNIKLLRDTLLKEIGFGNVFAQKGYEADDILASLCKSMSRQDCAIIVSADKDLFQLLNTDKVSVYNPITDNLTTHYSFQKEYGIAPREWIRVKAIAGCVSDNVVGVEGVAELSAIKFLKGQLKKYSAKYESIIQQGPDYDRNMRLVELPFPGVERFVLKEDKISYATWDAFCEKYAFTSLKGKPPIPSGRVKRRISQGFNLTNELA